MIEKDIQICGRPVRFKASAAIPRLYRAKFRRDIFKDLTKLERSFSSIDAKAQGFEVEDLEIFENVAYCMAYHADHSIPEDIEEWLDGFDMFSIYQILPDLLELWGAGLETQVESKKNFDRVSGR